MNDVKSGAANMACRCSSDNSAANVQPRSLAVTHASLTSDRQLFCLLSQFPQLLLQSDFPLVLLGRGRQHSPKDIVPHLAGNAETELKVLVMMSEVVSLHFTKISWETGVVKCIVAWTRHSLDEAPQI